MCYMKNYLIWYQNFGEAINEGEFYPLVPAAQIVPNLSASRWRKRIIPDGQKFNIFLKI